MSAPATRCPGEGLLVRHLDGELEEPARQAVDAHLSGCPGCAAVLERLRERDREVRAWLREHDPEPPGREAYDLTPPATAGAGNAGRGSGSGRGGARRWAAADVLVIALGAVAGPARGVVLAPLAGWFAGLVGAPGDDAGEVPLEGTPAPGPAATSFRWSGPELVLEFTSPTIRGTLTVEPTADSLVTFRGPATEVSLDVRPGTVLVDGGEAPDGDYGVAVPATLERVRIRRPGLPERVVDVVGLDGPVAVSLAAPSPSGGGPP